MLRSEKMSEGEEKLGKRQLRRGTIEEEGEEQKERRGSKGNDK